MIPYGRQSIDEADIEAVAAALRSDWLTQGPAIEAFEASLAQHCRSRYAVACNSGTAALHMAYAAAGVGPGSVVVVPTNTFLATANAAIYLGAEVRFCDVDSETGLMTSATLAAALRTDIGRRVRAVAPVHFAGQPCEMAAISETVQRLCPRATLIEDASHAIGGVHRDGSPVGSLGHSSMVTFSFHPVKHIAAGEGGAVTTDCPDLQKRLSSFRCHGMTKQTNELRRPTEGPWYYEMHAPGFNYRIPEMSCALASSQLKKLDRFVARRREIADHYLHELADIPGVSLPPANVLKTSAWHLFCLHVDFHALGRTRIEVMESLAGTGIGTQVHYYPVSLQPFYADRYGHTAAQFPGAMNHYERALSIPVFPAMTDGEVKQVISSIRHTFAGAQVARSIAA
ncbi:UDP-4-amino-4,6-dideoxy-N-acetyl-beta-L-altrosamine transaminase [Allorhodopirellula heiligendammensis]|uniref:UDP-4-amino-4-deoxy-L-arabinose--oxoglutarate aminotransferase n=1 Tax=Allorhodopirellula heiligendammensis TaxID=2714739 RepID=A0A5C6BTF4_9BACT|nr:UDP-4-amino-4,6-dideoxy-N-acetyl-beta-L-altrosamine transaminase [Allorhodopirellula heiligendammensis]TWU15122.1 UDP-4-amino-4-deoxy-L-arabinose--oxoglutarate aminotransferase [Allorhodopirellula heiligendammensis]